MPYFHPAEAFGGPVRVTFDVSKELAKRGHEVVVFTSDAKNLERRLDLENAEADGVRIHYLRNLSMFLVKRSKLFVTINLPKMLKSNLKSFSVVHLHEYTTYQNIVAHYFAKKYGIPYLLQAHGSLPKIGRKARKWAYDALFGSRLLRDASRVVALSQVEAEQFRQAGVPDERITIVPNGIDLSEYANPPSKGSFKKKLNIPSSKKMILYLGRVHVTKGIDFLIKSYAYMIKKMKCNNTLLLIAGPDDGYLAKAKSLADSLGVSESVLFTGFINDKDKLEALVDADLFVTPSFHGFPMTFLEACAVGTPIITTTLGDRLNWINGNVGYVTPPTYRDLARAAYEIISNTELADSFSRNCKLIVGTDFSLENTVDKLEHIYREVTDPN